jgi:DHA2 family multidrug resistance protein
MSKEQELTTEEWKPENNPWIVSFPVILAAFMFVLDGTIANVALPHMAGTFSISRDESLWILTSYLVASGVVIPAVDYFTKLFGRKVYFILSILLFTFASVMCACSK